MCVYIMIVMVILIIFVVAEAVIFAGGIALCVSIYRARKSAAPFFPTPKAAIRAALKEVALAPGETFYDLGTGTGRALIIAEKEFDARVTGFEISILFYCIARIDLWMRGSHATLLAENFFEADLRDADVIFCFLAIRSMEKMEAKLKAELKPGARVIVYAFPLPGMTPTRTITVHGTWKMFFYRI